LGTVLVRELPPNVGIGRLCDMLVASKKLPPDCSARGCGVETTE
jgi:hypothetical protein